MKTVWLKKHPENFIMVHIDFSFFSFSCERERESENIKVDYFHKALLSPATYMILSENVDQVIVHSK